MHISEYKRVEKLEDVHFWYKAMEKYILDFLDNNIKPGAKIFDAGCGTGGLAQKMMKFGEVTAMDINSIALRYTKKKNIYKVLKGTVEEIPFKNNNFDVVVCLDVLYHRKVKDDTRAIREFHRVLKPGGLLIIRLPAFEFLRGYHDIVVETRHRYTTGEIKDKLTQAGFETKKISYANMLLSLPLMIKRSFERMIKQQTFSSDTILLPELINQIFYKYLSFENKLLTVIDFPFGSSVIAIARKQT